MKSKISKILRKMLKSHWHHLGIEKDDYGCKYCLELVDKATEAIAKLTDELIDQCLKWNDSDTHIISDDMRKELK